MNPQALTPAHIQAVHQLYCQLTGQSLSLRFDRERLWFELLRLGYGPEDVRRVILYLQREIRAGRRNVGALKLSNLLQPDRFEEDLHISSVRLKNPDQTPSSTQLTRPSLPLSQQEKGRAKALEALKRLKTDLQLESGT